MSTILDFDDDPLLDFDDDPLLDFAPAVPSTTILGAHSPTWGDPETRLYVWLGLKRGNTLTLDADPYDRLNAGNILAGTAGVEPEEVNPTGPPGLWVDITCEVVSVTTHRGATNADGVIAKAEAGTATIVIADPTRRFDPIDPAWERLQPGCPVMIWTQVLQHGSNLLMRHPIFTGAIETITEPWTSHAGSRRCTIVATDAIAELAQRERPELAVPEEYAHERIARILDYYGGPPLVADTSSVRVQAGTLKDSAWEEIQRTCDAEVGFAYCNTFHTGDFFELSINAWYVALRFLARPTWEDEEVGPVVIPCGIVVGTSVSASDRQQRTRVTAGRANDEARREVTRSRPARREIAYRRTDLALTDAGLIPWAEYVLEAFDRPRAALTGVTLRPGAMSETWSAVASIDRLLERRITVDWTPGAAPEFGLPATVVEVTARVIGIEHSVTHARWEVTWTLADVDLVIAE